ncbi:epoxide hydrolase family protein [Streptomyces sp. NPDC094468]|uniref:epoxide hydrolase family protein n=1 Tax=Streptomyces sp. NPDC094468 TaxID=3366066 RepID=UPI0037FC3D6B
MTTARFNVPDLDIIELRMRLSSTRWPAPWPTEPWTAGTDEKELRRLTRYWADGFDWRAQEEFLNSLPSGEMVIGGHSVHYLKFDANGEQVMPILLSNGWPSTFFEMVQVAQKLADMSFAVVVPSIPGFTFSAQRPSLPADISTHEIWHQLMTGLGFNRYLAHGGDLGAGTTSRLAAAHPEAVIGAHLMAVGAPSEYDEATLTNSEREYLHRAARWTQEEGAYMHQQSTRPLTLAYGLSDSPTGLLAWIVEKYRAWSDSSGRLSNSFTDDFLLTQASLYWFTNTIGTSFRPYYEYGRGVPRGLQRVSVPTALALFPADLSQPPRSWAERTHNVVRYTKMPRGGHFAAVEEPDLLATDIAEFARTLGL